MAHFAKIEDGFVAQVVVVHNNELLVDGVENEQKGREFCHNLLGGTWIQTSYTNKTRKQFAGVGYTYDSVKDQFVAPRPFASWTLDSNNDWQAPTAMPNDGKMYSWDEASLAWVEVAI